jgi:two-component system sensor histidine kinase KdpD
VYLGYRHALIATVLSVLSFFFFFVPHTLASPIGSLPHIVILIGLLVSGMIVTHFITSAIDRANNANRHANQMMELYSLSRDLSTMIALDGIIETIMTHVKHSFRADACLYLSQDNHLELYQSSAGFPEAQIEKHASHEAFRRGQSTGISTPTPSHSESQAIYIPLRTAHQKVGVIGVAFSHNSLPTLEQHRLLDAFANQAALAIEANRLVEQAQEARIAREREKLQSALLDSISHDIRTPLVSITGALSSLREEAALFDEAMRMELIDDAWLETQRLNRLVENLLEMSRLQSGELKLNRDWHDPDEIIGVARSQLRERLREYRIKTHIQKNISLIYIDFTLMVQVLVNLLDNAAKYTSDLKTIEICTLSKPASIVFQIADTGTGIPEMELPHIFNKFYRASNVQSINGTGLGLSICAGIVEAHNGSIRAFNRPEGGAIFEVELPLEVTDG